MGAGRASYVFFSTTIIVLMLDVVGVDGVGVVLVPPLVFLLLRLVVVLVSVAVPLFKPNAAFRSPCLDRLYYTVYTSKYIQY